MENQAKMQPATPRAARALLQAAMGIFVITVVIGILNGLDLVEFPRSTLLTHLHAGTLGWITLGVFAAAFTLFTTDRGVVPGWLPPAAIVAVLAYVTAFYTTTGVLRPLAGSLVFLVILSVFVWVIGQLGRVATFSVAHLGIAAALLNLVIGAVFGVLTGLQLAGRLTGLPSGVIGAHAGAMIAGYLILAGMAIAEWKLIPERRPASRDRWGIAQVALLFLAGLALAVGALLDRFELISLNVPMLVVGTIIFLARVGRSAVRQHWLAPGSGRLFGISMLFLVVNISLLAYTIALIMRAEGDFNQIPRGLILAVDHSVFIGVMVNAIFGLIYEATQTRREFWPWVDQVMFWGINVGLAGFLVGLIADAAILKRIFTPLMGTSILLGILTYTIRLSFSRQRAAEPAMKPAGP